MCVCVCVCVCCVYVLCVCGMTAHVCIYISEVRITVNDKS